MHLLFRIITAAIVCFLPDAAFARDSLKGDASNDFAHSEIVPDKELAKQRGGFININGMLIDFNYVAQIAVNGNVVQDVNIDMSGVIAAAIADQENFMQPAIIQNVDNNTLIALQQTLNLNISGGMAVANSQAQINQAAFNGVIALH
jgi:hypothetical protein